MFALLDGGELYTRRRNREGWSDSRGAQGERSPDHHKVRSEITRSPDHQME